MSQLWLAYGTRSVPKLIEELSAAEADEAALCTSLTTLQGLLSNQEYKLQALSCEPLVPTLTQLLAHEPAEGEIPRLAALSLASLAFVYQGRVAVRDAGAIAKLIALCGSEPLQAPNRTPLPQLNPQPDPQPDPFTDPIDPNASPDDTLSLILHT